MTTAWRPGARIGATGLVLGEQIWSAEQLAKEVGTTVEAAQRWVGGLTVHVSERSAVELAAEAGRRCLERAQVSAADVQAVIFGSSAPLDVAEGRPELAVQQQVGASRAHAIDIGRPCSESITALRLGRALLADDAQVEHVLIAIGEKRSRRTLGYDAQTYQPVFSDAGAAVLLNRTGPLELLSFGDASNGAYWDFLASIRREVERGPPAEPAAQGPLGMDPRRLKLMVDTVSLNRAALAQCLTSAGVTKEAVTHLLLTREGPRLPHATLRQLGLRAEALVAAETGPTHAGMADWVISLDGLLREQRLQPENLVLLGSRAVGTVRFALTKVCRP